MMKRVKDILTRPSFYFEKIGPEKGVKDAFLFFMVMSIIVVFLGFIVNYFFAASLDMVSRMYGMEMPAQQLGFLVGFIFTVLGWGLGLGLSFVGAGILHVWCLIFDCKGDYTKTYQLAVYSRTPYFLFGWIPIVKYFVGIWGLVLLIIGTIKIHKIKRRTAILMYVIPYLVFLALGLLALFVMLPMLENFVDAGLAAAP
jgi:hypothetical protein